MFTTAELIKATGGRLFARPGINISGVSTDTRTLKTDEAFLAIKGKNFDGHGYLSKAVRQGASLLIVGEHFWKNWPKNSGSKIIPQVLVVKDTLKAYGDIANFHRRKFDIPVVGITGSSGKTSTKEIISHVLAQGYKVLKTEGTKNNLIGLPQTLLRLDKTYEACVLEMGTSLKGEIPRLSEIASPTIGVITNIGESHLEFFKKTENVFKEKMGLFDHIDRSGYAVLNKDDRYLGRAKPCCAVRYFGIVNKCAVRARNIIVRGGRLYFSVDRVRFSFKSAGRHNVYNALAAIAVGEILGISCRDMADRIKNYENPLKNRMAVYRTRTLCIIDDTYNSNPLSFRAAVTALSNMVTKGRKVMVSSDMLELGRMRSALHEEAGKFVAGSNIDILITAGELSKHTARGAVKQGMQPENISHFKTSGELVSAISGIVRPGDTVLVKGSRLMRMEDVTARLRRI